jgi:hypothetical protein
MIESGKIVGLYGIRLRAEQVYSVEAQHVLVATFDNQEDAFKYVDEVTLSTTHQGFYDFHPDSVLAGFEGWNTEDGRRIIHNPKA